MSKVVIRANMTDAELIDEGLDCEQGSLAYRLAVTLDALPINQGSVSLHDASCSSCSDLESQICDLEQEVSSLQSTVEGLDVDRLIAGVKKAKQAVSQAHDKVNYILGLGGDDE